jgi:hypothetical protein
MNATPSTSALSGPEIQAALRNYGLSDAKIKFELQATGLTPAALLERIVDVQTSLAHYQANRAGARPASSASSSPVQPVPARTSASAPVAAAPAPAPPRSAWTSAQMDERVRRIVQSHWAQGRKAVAVQLCSSPCSIEEAIGVLKASAADSGSPEERAALAAATRAQGTQPAIDRAAIFDQYRGGVEGAKARARAKTIDPRSPGGGLNPQKIYDDRRAARRQPAD